MIFCSRGTDLFFRKIAKLIVEIFPNELEVGLFIINNYLSRYGIEKI